MVAAAVPGEDVAIHVDDEDLTAQYPETSTRVPGARSSSQRAHHPMSQSRTGHLRRSRPRPFTITINIRDCVPDWLGAAKHWARQDQRRRPNRSR